jgi:hypothetical protein
VSTGGGDAEALAGAVLIVIRREALMDSRECPARGICEKFHKREWEAEGVSSG